MRDPLLSREVFPLAVAFLGNISALQNLSLVRQDANDGILTDQYFDYLESWRFLHTALFERTWPDLELVRLQVFRAPDELLSRFIVKHASSLRKEISWAAFSDILNGTVRSLHLHGVVHMAKITSEE
jgi:hypothetical protein